MKVSIITACYNAESTIERCLNSINNQDYSNIEHIVIDGASDDKTLEILEKQQNSISHLVSEQDNGIYDALNKGIKLATGDIIGFLHADDLFASQQTISQIVALFNQKNTDSVYGDLEYISSKGKIIRYWKSSEFTLSKLKKGWMPPHPTFFVRASVYQKCGLFDTKFKIAADYDFMLRVLGRYKISTAYLPLIITKMQLGGASNKNIRNILIKMKEDFIALRKNKIGGISTIFWKNISKIPQFFSKK